jgi:hypothetical protein
VKRQRLHFRPSLNREISHFLQVRESLHVFDLSRRFQRNERRLSLDYQSAHTGRKICQRSGVWSWGIGLDSTFNPNGDSGPLAGRHDHFQAPAVEFNDMGGRET